MAGRLGPFCARSWFEAKMEARLKELRNFSDPTGASVLRTRCPQVADSTSGSFHYRHRVDLGRNAGWTSVGAPF